MRRNISESKHKRYLETVGKVVEKLSKEDSKKLLKQVEVLDTTYQQFYALLRKARVLAMQYDALQTQLTKRIRDAQLAKKEISCR